MADLLGAVRSGDVELVKKQCTRPVSNKLSVKFVNILYKLVSL